MKAAQEIKLRIETASLSRNTLRNYRSNWKSFEQWCRDAGAPSLPADAQTCIDHAAWCIAEGLRLETVYLRLSAIKHFHRRNNLASPVEDSVSQFLRNARRNLCEKPQGMRALEPDLLKRLTTALSRREKPKAARDCCLVVLGFALGWRCSELVGLDLRDISWAKEGIGVWLGRSKTDQEGRGRSVGVQHGKRRLTCPVRALRRWLDVRGDWAGPLFTQADGNGNVTRKRLSPDGVRRAVKNALESIGENAELFGAHSLRSGMITAAIEAGATETAVMQRTGHKRYETVRRYVRGTQIFRANPLKGVL